MVFWGIEVKPGRPYAHTLEEWRGHLHVSMATLGLGSSTSKSVLQCNVGDKSPVFLCCLYPERTECVQLNLEFAEFAEVIFSVIGPRSIHLSGFHHRPAGNPNEENSESFGLDIADTESDEVDHSDDQYGGSFINDGEPGMLSPSSGDESLDEKKPKKDSNGSKNRRLRKTHQVSSESDEEPNPKKNSKGNKKRRLRKAHQVSSESEEEPLSPALGISSGDEDMASLFTLVKPKKGTRNIKNASKAKVETPKKKTKDDRRPDLQTSEDGRNKIVTPKKKQKKRSGNENVREVEGKAKSTEDQQTQKFTEQSESAHNEAERVEGDIVKEVDCEAKVGSITEDQQTSKTTDHSESALKEAESAEDDIAKEIDGEAKVGSITEDQQTSKTTDHSKSTERDGERPKNENQNEDGKEVEGEAKVGSIAEDQQTAKTTDNSESADKDGERPTNKNEYEDAKEVEGESKIGSIVGDQQMLKIMDLSESSHKDCERPKNKERKENGRERADRPRKRKKGVSKHESSNLVNDIEEGKEKQGKAKDERKEVGEVTESKRKMKKKIKKAEDNSAAKAQSPVEENNTTAKDVEDNQMTDAKASKVRTLQTGLTIVELKSGESDGNVAVAGKKIGVRYECKLKSTGRVVESNYVKFRLGARKVAEGWEDGLQGMRVGEKRQLTVPPGVVKVGDGKNVPQDSWLVYEVELVKFR